MPRKEKKAFFSTRKETSIVGPTLLCREHAGIVGRVGNMEEQAPSRFRNESPIPTSHSRAGVFKIHFSTMAAELAIFEVYEKSYRISICTCVPHWKSQFTRITS
ncbi:hypothetical protein V2G26_000377 [Clonostachys chloroleuca]